MTAFTFVTVVFDAELDLLELQARSFRRHVDERLVHEIILIDNSRRGLGEKRSRALRDQYGPHGARVRIVRPKEVARIPRTTGWYAQQVLKLLIAGQITSDAYVVLDAKNHLVRKLDTAFLETEDGRLRTSRQSFAGHRLEPDLRRTLAYFGLPLSRVQAFTPTITPFVLRTELVASMIEDVESRARRPFAVEFLRARLLEFFAYAAWVETHEPGLEQVYDFGQPASPTVWPRGADARGVDVALERVRDGASPWFSVHRRALGVLDEHALQRLSNLWIAAGLFSSPDATAEFVSRAQKAVRAGERRQRRMDLIPRGLRAVRRVTSRRA